MQAKLKKQQQKQNGSSNNQKRVTLAVQVCKTGWQEFSKGCYTAYCYLQNSGSGYQIQELNKNNFPKLSHMLKFNLVNISTKNVASKRSSKDIAASVYYFSLPSLCGPSWEQLGLPVTQKGAHSSPSPVEPGRTWSPEQPQERLS